MKYSFSADTKKPHEIPTGGNLLESEIDTGTFYNDPSTRIKGNTVRKTWKVFVDPVTKISY